MAVAFYVNHGTVAKEDKNYMKNFSKSDYFLIAFSSIVASVFLVMLVASGATTIGTNITTTGTASSTSATTTDYLYVGYDITEPDGWDFSGGDLIVSGAAYFAAKATSTTAFAVGAGTIDSLDMAGGDLYVQDDVEVDGWASTTSALNTQGTLHVGGNASVDGTFTFGTSTTPVHKFSFGICSVAFTGSSVASSATTTADCTATDVIAGDRVFMTPTSLEKWLVFNSASSTVDGTIQVQVFNSSSTAAVITVANNWYWMAVR